MIGAPSGPKPSQRGTSKALSILFTSTYYWPETAGNAPYVTGLAECLASKGHRVAVAAGFAHYPSWRMTDGAFARNECKDGVEIRRRWHYVPARQSAVTRALYEATLLGIGLTGLPTWRPDVVIGVSPTLAAAAHAYLAGRLYGRPYGLIFQDLLGRAAVQSGVVGGGSIGATVGMAELALARRAAAVAVIADGFRDHFAQAGIPRSRIHRVRNWSLGGTPDAGREETRRRLGWRANEWVCLHAGNMGHKQELVNVLRAAEQIQDDSIRVVLAGDGNERPYLEAVAARIGLTNVSFLPPQPPGPYEAMLAAADVLLINQRHSVGDMSLASKLTSYFSSGVPVLAAVAADSETAKELRQAGTGIIVPPHDPPSLARAITDSRRRAKEIAPLGDRGKRYARATLTAAAVMPAYETFVEEIARVTP